MAQYIEYIGPEGKEPRPRNWAGTSGSDFVQFLERDICFGRLTAIVELPEVAEQMCRVKSRFVRYTGPFNGDAKLDDSSKDWNDIASNAVQKMTDAARHVFVNNLIIGLSVEEQNDAAELIVAEQSKPEPVEEEVSGVDAEVDDEPLEEAAEPAPMPTVDTSPLVTYEWLQKKDADEVRRVGSLIEGVAIGNANSARSKIAKNKVTQARYETLVNTDTVPA